MGLIVRVQIFDVYKCFGVLYSMKMISYHFIPGAGQGAWFLEIIFVRTSVCLCMCVCAYAHDAPKAIDVKLSLNSRLNNLHYFRVSMYTYSSKRFHC